MSFQLVSIINNQEVAIFYLTFELDKDQDYTDIAVRVFLSKSTEMLGNTSKYLGAQLEVVSRRWKGQRQSGMKQYSEINNLRLRIGKEHVWGLVIKPAKHKIQASSPRKKADKCKNNEGKSVKCYMTAVEVFENISKHRCANVTTCGKPQESI